MPEHDPERCARELKAVADLYNAGNPDRRGLELAIEDWCMEELRQRMESGGIKD